MSSTLDQIAQRHGTDKSSLLNALTEKYEMYLAPRRAEPLVLLEIGIYEGASIRTWHEYFPHATIVGVDVVAAPADLCDLAPRVTTFRADQSDAEQLRAIAERLRAAGGLDIVIDDGSHLCSHQIASYKALYPFLNPGGIYFAEDVTTSYREDPYGGGLGRPDTFIRFAQDLVPFIPMSMGCVPARHPWEADLDFVHFSGYGGLVAVGKLSAARKAKIRGHGPVA
jgi:hypothetical protein